MGDRMYAIRLPSGELWTPFEGGTEPRRFLSSADAARVARRVGGEVVEVPRPERPGKRPRGAA